MTLFIPAMWAIIRFFHAAASLTLVTSTIMAAELAAQVGATQGGCWGALLGTPLDLQPHIIICLVVAQAPPPSPPAS